MEVNYDEPKLTELLLYIAERLLPDTSGGATKLNKVLYFVDFTHVRRTGSPITGAEYQKLRHDPAPRRLKPARMIRRVVVGAAALEKAHNEFGEGRTTSGALQSRERVVTGCGG